MKKNIENQNDLNKNQDWQNGGTTPMSKTNNGMGTYNNAPFSMMNLHSLSPASNSEKGMDSNAFNGPYSSQSDLTIRKENEELKVLIKQLQESNEKLKSFAHVISHDLKGPLRTINSFGALLENRYADQLDESGKEFLRLIRTSAGSMDELINEMLESSKRPNPHDVSKVKEIDLNLVLKEVIDLLSERIKYSKATIYFTDMPTILGYHFEFIQLFQNLICNSLKFSHHQRDPIIQIICVESKADLFYIEVKDNGMGISPERRSLVFEKFFKEENKNSEGTGLGLFTCNKIVENYGGKISLESEENKGTSFNFTLQSKRLSS